MTMCLMFDEMTMCGMCLCVRYVWDVSMCQICPEMASAMIDASSNHELCHEMTMSHVSRIEMTVRCNDYVTCVPQ